MSSDWLLWEHKQVGQMETSALQTSGSYWTNAFVAAEKKKKTGRYTLHYQSITTQGAGLIVTSSFNLDRAISPFLAASARKPVPRNGKREKSKELHTAVLRTCWGEDSAFPLIPFFPLCTYAQGGLHHLPCRLSKRLACNLVLLPVTTVKWKWTFMLLCTMK